MALRTRIITGAIAMALALIALAGCSGSAPSVSVPYSPAPIVSAPSVAASGNTVVMTPNKLAQLVLAASAQQNSANPMVDVSCDPQTVLRDGSGTYECTESFESGMSWRDFTVKPDGSWAKS